MASTRLPPKVVFIHHPSREYSWGMRAQKFEALWSASRKQTAAQSEGDLRHAEEFKRHRILPVRVDLTRSPRCWRMTALCELRGKIRLIARLSADALLLGGGDSVDDERRMLQEALFYRFSLERRASRSSAAQDRPVRRSFRARAHLGAYYSDVGYPDRSRVDVAHADRRLLLRHSVRAAALRRGSPQSGVSLVPPSRTGRQSPRSPDVLKEPALAAFAASNSSDFPATSAAMAVAKSTLPKLIGRRPWGAKRPRSTRVGSASPCRLLIGERGQRRSRIPYRDQPIEAEHLSLSLKETGLQDPIKRAVPLHQLSGAFWSHSGSAKQFVRRITAQRNEVRHLVWIDANCSRTSSGPMRAISPPRAG